MTAIRKPVELPDDVWREIASKDPSVCLALARVSKPLRRAVADQAKLADVIARDDYPQHVRSLIGSKQARKEHVEQALQHHKSAKRIWTVGLLPIACEIKGIRRRKSNGLDVNPNGYAVAGVLHLALSPLIVPLRIHSRITHLNKTRDRVKDTVENVRHAQARADLLRLDLCDAIAKDPRWSIG